MRFLELTAENFGTLNRVSLPLDNQGLVLITGRNLDAPKADSNGAGKSLLLDAFTWCLWGQTVRGDKDDAVINRRVRKNCLVSVSFEEAGILYIVKRFRKHEQSRKPNDLELWIGDEDASGASIQATQSKIEDVLGLDFTTFCVMMPGAGLNAADMTDKSIKLLLEKLLQTDAVEAAYKAALDNKKIAEARVSSLEMKQSSLDTSISEAEALMKSYVEARDSFSTKVQAKLESVQKRKQDTHKELSICKERLKILEDLPDKIEEAKSKVEDATAAVNRAITYKNDLQSRIDTIYAEYKEELAVLTNQEDILGAQLDNLDDLSAECELCHQVVTEDIRTSTRDRLNECLNDLRRDINNLSIGYKSEADAYLAARSEAQTEYEKVVSERDLAVTSLDKLKALRSEVSSLDYKLGSLNERYEELIDEESELSQEENPFSDLIATLTTDTAAKVVEHSQVSTELLSAEVDLELCEFWVEGFSPKGLRGHMLEQVTPVLNKAVGKYSSILTDNEMSITFHTRTKLKNGKVKENFRIHVEQKHGGESYKSNSTGERGRANLAIAFALGDLAAMRANKRIPFRFLDEPFENIDETGIEGVLFLLQETRDKYDTVYVITHNDKFKKLFQKEVVVTKEDGFSRLE